MDGGPEFEEQLHHAQPHGREGHIKQERDEMRETNKNLEIPFEAFDDNLKGVKDMYLVQVLCIQLYMYNYCTAVCTDVGETSARALAEMEMS